MDITRTYDHVTVRWHGRLVYDGPVITGTITDRDWWTRRRRLWIALTPAGRACLRQQIRDLEATVQFGSAWDAAANDVHEALERSFETQSITGQEWASLADAPRRDYGPLFARDALPVEDDPFPGKDD